MIAAIFNEKTFAQISVEFFRNFGASSSATSVVRISSAARQMFFNSSPTFFRTAEEKFSAPVGLFEKTEQMITA